MDVSGDTCLFNATLSLWRKGHGASGINRGLLGLYYTKFGAFLGEGTCKENVMSQEYIDTLRLTVGKDNDPTDDLLALLWRGHQVVVCSL